MIEYYTDETLPCFPIREWKELPLCDMMVSIIVVILINKLPLDQKNTKKYLSSCIYANLGVLWVLHSGIFKVILEPCLFEFLVGYVYACIFSPLPLVLIILNRDKITYRKLFAIMFIISTISWMIYSIILSIYFTYNKTEHMITGEIFTVFDVVFNWQKSRELSHNLPYILFHSKMMFFLNRIGLIVLGFILKSVEWKNDYRMNGILILLIWIWNLLNMPNVVVGSLYVLLCQNLVISYILTFFSCYPIIRMIHEQSTSSETQE